MIGRRPGTAAHKDAVRLGRVDDAKDAHRDRRAARFHAAGDHRNEVLSIPCAGVRETDPPGSAHRMHRMNRREFVLGAAALALAPREVARAAGGGAHAVALVTADLESRLVAVDLSSGRVRSNVRTAASPSSIETVGGTAVVAHAAEGAVSLVRGATLEVVHVLRGFAEPRYTAGHPAGRHAFVT